jgi:NAD(P)-dependent dehydrogenase (short-subunit alcohol dehydrogenase family)
MALPWRHAIVVGASSGIGAAVARALGAADCRVALVARRATELTRVADEIPGARVYPHDVRHYDEIPGLVQQIARDLGGLDLVVYAAGVMPRIGDQEYDFAKDREILETNLLGAVAWLNETAARFAGARAGTIVGISSVAGDRGRRGNPAYCTSKAAFTTYLEALRNRVGRLGVTVVTIKPGPVDTAMTHGLERTPMIIRAEDAAHQILRAARRGRPTSYVPARWRPIMFLLRQIPSFIFQRLNV